MDKKTVVLVTIIVILATALAVTSTFLVMYIKQDITFTQEEDEKIPINNELNEDKQKSTVSTVELKNVTTEDNKIKETFSLNMNGAIKELVVEFEQDSNKEVDGKYNEVELFEGKLDSYTTDEIKKVFNEKNFAFIKGLDNKTYLVIASDGMDEDEMHVFDSELNEIKAEEDIHITYNFESEKLNNANPWYIDTFNVTANNVKNNAYVHAKVDKDKIYFLALKDDNTLEERVYTINNNTLTYTVSNTFSNYEVVTKKDA